MATTVPRITTAIALNSLDSAQRCTSVSGCDRPLSVGVSWALITPGPNSMGRHRQRYARMHGALLVEYAMVVIAVCLPVLATCAPSREAQDPVPQGAATVFWNAMATGKAQVALDIAARTLHAGPFWLSLYRDRLRYRLPTMIAKSMMCRNAKSVQRIPLLECEAFLREATYALGDAHDFFAELAWQRDHPLSPTGGAAAGDTVEEPFANVDVARLARSLPPFSTEFMVAKSPVLRYTNRHSSAIGAARTASVTARSGVLPAGFRPEVEVTINGHRVDALVDTGTRNALVIGSDEALTLGLRPLVRGVSGYRLIGQRPPASAQVGLDFVRSLVLGSLHVRNLMALVVPRNPQPGFRQASVVVGLPMLARFDSVTFTRTGMVFDEPSATCSAQFPLTAAAPAGDASLLVFPTSVDGMPVGAMIDTGSTVELLVGNSLIPRHLRDQLPRYFDPQDAKSLNVSMRLGPLGTFDYVAPIVRGLPAAVDADLGFPLAWSHTEVGAVGFNFAQMRLCLRSASQRQPIQDRGRANHVGSASAPTQQAPLWLHLGLLDGIEDPDSFAPEPLMRSSIRAGAASQSSGVIRMPLRLGMDLYPARGLVEAYAPPPPPWVHVHMSCAIYHGVAYLRGSITGNFGRPLPGITEYFGQGDSIIGSYTTNLSGRFSVPLALGQSKPMLPNMTRTPVDCVRPSVHVGHESPVN